MQKMNNIEWAVLKNNFLLAQRNDKFKFGTDAVLLSYFATIKSKYNVIDLCSGTGAVGYLCYLRYNTQKTILTDIDEDMVELSRITALKNGVSDKFIHITSDIYNLDSSVINNQWADYITVNPPYFYKNSGKTNENFDVNVARHCEADFLDAVFKKASFLLKFGGKIAMINRSEYLSDIIFSMKSNNIEPKKIRLVHSYVDKNSILVLIEGMKGASPSIICEPPLILYEQNGEYTEEFRKIQEL